jgi:acetyl-CoA synthetase
VSSLATGLPTLVSPTPLWLAEGLARGSFLIPFSKHPAKPHLTMERYKEEYKLSIENPTKFWGAKARELLDWDLPFKTVTNGSFEHGDVCWFPEGRLNACYNAVDRHAFKEPNRPAIIYEADEPSEGRTITYGELLREVSKLSYTLKQMGVKKGDTVAVYMPMIPEALVTLLAIVRIGAVHSVVFAGFSSESLRDRVLDANSRVVITTDEGKRGGKVIGTKRIVDEALKQCPEVKNVIVFRRTGADVPMTKGRDYWWHEETAKYPGYCAPALMDAEDPMFLLYTSGSTGKPKGVMHTTAGYLLGAAMTGKYVFDLHPGDKLATAGDVGWITGHTYVVYAPLVLGVTTLVFEGTPAYPNFSRYWDIIEKHKITQFYVAPTALRLLKRAGDHHINREMKSLRVLGSVGEPIAGDVWKWYHEKVGHEVCHVVDVSSPAMCSAMRLTISCRPTGKPRPVRTSLPRLPAARLPSPVVLLFPSLELNRRSLTLCLAWSCTATMWKEYWHSRSPGPAWHEVSGLPTSATWIPT